MQFKQKTDANTSLKYPALSIPNILSYFRIILIPFFVIAYMTATDAGGYLIAAVLVAVSGITDFCDGFIARKFNMITELGKFVDPLADKLTQFALIICFVVKYPLTWLLVGIYVAKEGFIAMMALLAFTKKKRKLKGAKWFGKVATAVLFVIMAVLMLFPNIPIEAANALIIVCAAFMLMAFALYIPVYIKLWKGLE